MAVRKLSSTTGLHLPSFSGAMKSNETVKSRFYAAMWYVHYEITPAQLKKEVIKYVKSINANEQYLEYIKGMNENRFITIGKYIYLLNHGCELPEDVMPKVLPTLEKILEEEKKKTASSEKDSKDATKKQIETNYIKPIISIQDRILDKASEVAGEVEGWVDDFLMDKTTSAKTVPEFINLFNTYSLKSPHAKHLQSVFLRSAREIEEAVAGKDKDLNEAYSNYSKAELKKIDMFYKNLFVACNMLQDSAKIERAPRKKKAVSADKVVSKVKYKKDDKSLGIVSLNPAQILNAKEVWVYSTKTRKLSQYKALDVDGLGVKGASLVNFSADSAEKTLRKPAEALADFKKSSKVKLRTFLKDLTTIDTPCSGKINEHHIILRIDK